jgi:hypothetical protein
MFFFASISGRVLFDSFWMISTMLANKLGAVGTVLQMSGESGSLDKHPITANKL